MALTLKEDGSDFMLDSTPIFISEPGCKLTEVVAVYKS